MPIAEHALVLFGGALRRIGGNGAHPTMLP
jgi:hypothetical protein